MPLSVDDFHLFEIEILVALSQVIGSEDSEESFPDWSEKICVTVVSEQ